MYVLLTNDDGINASGLRALYRALGEAGHEVAVAAPMRQQSGVSNSLTVFEPLRAATVRDGDFCGTGVYGTPTDCVKLALGRLLPRRPDLVMSGINLGPNAGPDIAYSGTVAAAAEAARASVPAIAISHGCHLDNPHLDEVARHAVRLAEKMPWRDIPARRVINVNYPNGDPGAWKGTRICSQSPAVWTNDYCEHRDPRSQPYWWFNGEIEPGSLGADSDRHLLLDGYITITPLKFEYTDHDTLSMLADKNFDD